MERHSVPQNIMDVEFKLFGALTIKQFAYLAGGILTALIIYFVDFPFLLKFVLILFSVVMGFFLSLVRINGQSSAVFVTNFILALFTSQQRIWKKTAKTPDILKEKAATPLTREDVQVVKKLSRQEQRQIPVAPLADIASHTDKGLDKVEEDRLGQIEKHFDFAVKDLEGKYGANEVKRQVRPPSTPPQVEVNMKEPNTNLDLSGDNLAGNVEQKQIDGDPLVKTPNYAAVFRRMDTVKPNRAIDSSNEVSKLESEKLEAELMSDGSEEDSIQQQEPPAEITNQQQITEPVKQKQIQQNPVGGESDLNTQATILEQERQNVEAQIEVDSQKRPPQEEVKKQSPPPPQYPAGRKPNIIAGVVMTKDNKAIPLANVSIKDARENLVRKIVTDKNGAFALSTPLANGIYHIDIDAEGFKFNRFELILSGQPLPNYKFSTK